MNPKHTNPSWQKPRYDRNARQEVHARAPYNFIPLPDQILRVDDPPPQDQFTGLTGWIDVEFETKSPVYIRGMMTEKEQRDNGPAELSIKEKEARSPFFNLNEQPVVPGSSLRGLFHTLVEVIGYGRMRWVGDIPSFTFRAVAAQKDDPLREPYRGIIGAFNANVRAGYLIRNENRWFIRPAVTLEKMNWPGKSNFLKIYERQIGAHDIPGFLRFNSPNYRPQLHEISFNAEVLKGEKDLYLSILQIGPPDANYQHKGVLVCSGNMRATGAGRQSSPRKAHTIILEPATADGILIPISPKAVQDYRNSMTPFQNEKLVDWGGPGWGCLRDGAPVFYVPSKNGKEVNYFGHNPNFRIPVRLPGADHAANPTDFIPEKAKDDEWTDLADALFGWTQEPGSKRKTSCAGRVFFGDARMLPGQTDIWYREEATIPHVLGAPKATTFQHYLVQDRSMKHDPDYKETLAHYGVDRPETTQIRGIKMYWHKGRHPQIEASTSEREHETQLTRIRPLNPGVRFQFRLRFENLREWELGALQWSLQPHGKNDKTYCQKLGMGKPLGMGAISIQHAHVYLTYRKVIRYQSLFKVGERPLAWEQGEILTDHDYRADYETYICARLNKPEPFNCLEQIQELLTILEWRGDTPGDDWLDWTRYMEIERGTMKVNEYKERPVLPTPSGVLAYAAGKSAFTPSVSPKNPGEPVISPLKTSLLLPQPGNKVHGTVIDIEPNGKIWLEIDDVAAPPDIEVTGLISPENLGGKKLSEGLRVRLEVIETKTGKGEWLLNCRTGPK